MPKDGGKYDHECMMALGMTGAKAVMLIVLGGLKGSGHEFQMRIQHKSESVDLLETIAKHLREIADTLDEDRTRIQAELRAQSD